MALGVYVSKLTNVTVWFLISHSHLGLCPSSDMPSVHVRSESWTSSLDEA